MIFTIDIKLNVIYNSMLVYNCNFDQIKNVVQADWVKTYRSWAQVWIKLGLESLLIMNVIVLLLNPNCMNGF